MMVILWIIIWFFIVTFGLILLVIAISAVPLKYHVHADICNNPVVKIRASWFFKLVRVVYKHGDGKQRMDIHVAWHKIGKKRRAKPKRKRKKRPDTSKKADFSAITKVLSKTQADLTGTQGKTIMKHAFAALGKFLRVLAPKHVYVHGVVGCADPAATGMFIGAYEAVAAAFCIRDKVCIDGNFSEAMLQLTATVEGSISIFRMTLPAIWFLTRKPVRAMIWKELIS